MPVPVSSRSTTVCVIGAGVSGICAAVQLKRLLGLSNVTVYEKNSDLGGVWHANQYPGCANDTPSVSYTYTFEPKTDFSRSFVTNKDTCDYLRSVVTKYDVYSQIKFNTQVQSLIWDEELKKWNVIIENENQTTQRLFYDIVICATGLFRIPNIPKEFLNFKKGPVVHTAEWDDSINLKNKKVAVVGNGSSATQLISTIAEQVEQLHVYQREPNWNVPFRPDFKIPTFVQWILTHVPLAFFLVRFAIFLAFEFYYVFFRVDWNYRRKLERFALWCLKKDVGKNEKLLKDLTPNFPIGCKRITRSNEYISTMTRANVTLHTNSIKSVTTDSIVTKDNKETKIDVLILGTGFRLYDYFAPMKIIGRHGVDILNLWQKSAPTMYLSVITHTMPNLFTLLGPVSDSGSTNGLAMAEMQIKFVVKILQEMFDRKSQVVMVKPNAEEKFMKNVRLWLKRLVQGSGSCDGSYYRNERNENTIFWPLTGTEYRWKTRHVKSEDFEFL